MTLSTDHRMFKKKKMTKNSNNHDYKPVQVKSSYLRIVSVIACVWLSFDHIVSVVPERGWK